ncbi:MAG: T9SS type A sorting domain-containing protein [Bacteroidales bacterium]|jgi:hypothetical protein|nr:T9SS type A sorting domain-containing protein [Bacteroidales bacterium]
MKKILILMFVLAGAWGMNAQQTTTAQDTIIRRTILWDENYNDGTTIPDNWMISGTTTNKWSIASGMALVNSANGATSWLTSKKGFNIEEGKTYKITFDLQLGYSAAGGDVLHVELHSAVDSFDRAETVLVKTLDQPITPSSPQTIEYVATGTGVKYISLHIASPTNSENRVIFDNLSFSLEEVTTYPIAHKEGFETYTSQYDALDAWTRTYSTEEGNSWTVGYAQKSFPAAGNTLPAPNGEKYAFIEGSKNASDAWFISPDYALESGKTYTFKFNVVMAGFKGADQVLNVKYGQGQTAGAMTKDLASYTEHSSNWGTKFIEFTPESDGNYNFGFQCATPAGNGDYLLLDNITIVDGVIDVIDVAVVAINPTQGTTKNFTRKEPIQITIQNNGKSAAGNFPVSYSIDGGAAKTVVFTGTIEPNATAVYEFQDSADLWLNGERTIMATTLNINDDVPSNNAMSVKVTSTTEEYDVMIMTTSTPNSANPVRYKENEAITVNIRNNSSVPITNFPVSFQVTQTKDENLETVEVKKEAVTETVEATILPNATLEYRFTATADLSALGEYTITRYAVLPNDLGKSNDTAITTGYRSYIVDLALEIVSPIDGTSAKFEDDTIRVKITNMGMYTYTGSIPVSYQVDDIAATKKDGSITAAMYGGSLKPDSSYVYTFTAPADLWGEGEHTIKAWSRYAVNPQEQNRANDTATITVTTVISGSSVQMEKAAHSIVVYPNPTSDKLFIDSENVKRAEIYTVQGKLMKTVRTNTTEISVENLKTGAYILKLTTDQGVESIRFVKH